MKSTTVFQPELDQPDNTSAALHAALYEEQGIVPFTTESDGRTVLTAQPRYHFHLPDIFKTLPFSDHCS